MNNGNGLLRPLLWIMGVSMGLVACDDGSKDPGTELPLLADQNQVQGKSDWYQPPVAITWQWQLQGTLNSDYPVALYDVDLFDTPKASIEQLQAVGKKVICYFSAGSYEDWRSDAAAFRSQDLGKPLDGWEGERWLDIRSQAVRTLMQQRLDLARDKGCDGVEPDNMDGYTNNTGFALTAADQLAFNREIAVEAHRRHLSVGLKNDLNQITDLVVDFDFSVNEQCFEFDECDLLLPFIKAGKPVLNVEYRKAYVDDASRRKALCAEASNRRFSTLILPLNLDDSFRYACF